MPEEIKARVILFPEADVWIAQCIEFDIAAQGRNREECAQRFVRQLEAEIELSVEKSGAPLAGIPPAPLFYVDMFERAFTPAKSSPAVETSRARVETESRVLVGC